MKTSKTLYAGSNSLTQDVSREIAQETPDNTAKTRLLGTGTLDVFTFQAWIKTSHGGLVFQYFCEFNHTGFMVKLNAQGHIESVVNSRLLSIEMVSIPGEFNDDYWHLLSISYQYHKLKCYIDGDEIELQQQITPLTVQNTLKAICTEIALFDGEITNISLIENCLTDNQILDYYRQPYVQDSITDNNLYTYSDKQSKMNIDLNPLYSVRQEVMLIIFNDTEYQFIKNALNTNNFNKQLPNSIPANERCAYIIESNNQTWPHFIYQANYITEEKPDIELTFDILKSLTPKRSHVHLQLANELTFDCFISQSTPSRLIAEIRISETRSEQARPLYRR
ncbi:LamG-like jellyroll fold domain-containing protein [Shewanella putrefaciens]|uniref:LamG-like jellyroll fold domain-containing protein n=1 Tax=Shewanella putrefaciens TaxID=24 RepID=UPI0018E6F762|nr:LamG-like jellyroll fold domain-containing protein [Shewanella putrefaciens]